MTKYLKKKKYYIISFISVLLIIFVLFILFLPKNNNFEFKQLSTACDNFNISGSVAYNDNKKVRFKKIRICLVEILLGKI